MVTPLAALTTLRLGGPARDLVAVSREDELVADDPRARRRRRSRARARRGSNVVIADAGFDGTVVRVVTRGVARTARPSPSRPASPGTSSSIARSRPGWPASSACRASPVPTGATPIQNVGAYGQDVAQTIEAVRVLDRPPAGDRAGGGRSAASATAARRFKGRDHRVVLAVRFRLTASELSGRSPTPSWRPSSASRSASARARMTCATPCSSCAGPRGWSWTRPTPTRSAPARSSRTRSWMPMRSRPSARRRRRPRWHEPDGRIKSSAAWLIGRPASSAATRAAPSASPKHTLALINRGGATTAELLALAARWPARVRDALRRRARARAGVRRACVVTPRATGASSPSRCSPSPRRSPSAWRDAAPAWPACWPRPGPLAEPAAKLGPWVIAWARRAGRGMGAGRGGARAVAGRAARAAALVGGTGAWYAFTVWQLGRGALDYAGRRRSAGPGLHRRGRRLRRGGRAVALGRARHPARAGRAARLGRSFIGGGDRIRRRSWMGRRCARGLARRVALPALLGRCAAARPSARHPSSAVVLTAIIALIAAGPSTCAGDARAARRRLEMDASIVVIAL